MKTSFFVILAVVWFLCVGVSCPVFGSPRVIDVDAKEGEPYKEAARILLRAIAAGDVTACKAAFIGEGDDFKLMEPTLASNSAVKELNDAVVANVKVGDQMPEDFVTPELRSIDV